jgi:uncharacterized RDD family membrane protein YckC
MQTIDIRTTQNVTIEYELASLRERMLAFSIDLLIVVTGYFVLLSVVVSVYKGLGSSGERLWYIFYVLSPISGFLLYQFLSETLANGQSWGKKIMGIKVVRVDGLEPSLSDYFLRAVFQLVDSLFSLGIVGALLISSSPKNQRLGDRTANTTVIRTRHSTRFQLQDILKINSLENYTPQYPQVRRLTEPDMLLIKHLLARQRQYPNDAHNAVVQEAVTHISTILDLPETPKNKVEFLKTLIRDYIVLTR